jgi:hypothetical protein
MHEDELQQNVRNHHLSERTRTWLQSMTATPLRAAASASAWNFGLIHEMGLIKSEAVT